MTIFAQNIEALRQHYPPLAERVLTYPDKENLVAFETKDGGLAYALKKETGIEYLTDPVNPVTRIGNQLQANSSKLNDFSLPVMVIGTYPGDEILYLFDLCEKTPAPHAAQKLYVCIDSLPCFCAFLQTMDTTRIIQSDRVKLFWHEEADVLADEFRQKPELSYLFTLITGALNGSVNKVMKPFISLAQERSAETQRLMAENETYYDAISDEDLASVISMSPSLTSLPSVNNSCHSPDSLTKGNKVHEPPLLTSLSSVKNSGSLTPALPSAPTFAQATAGMQVAQVNKVQDPPSLPSLPSVNNSCHSPDSLTKDNKGNKDQEPASSSLRSEATADKSSGLRSQVSAFSSNRPPRLMTLTSSWSTVTQYGARDLCEAMESAGWQTRKLNVDGTPTAHYIASQINDFKPDVFVFVNHLRTECPALFPKNMMFITWIQDTVPQINNHEAAAKWNEYVTGKKPEVRSQKSAFCNLELETQNLKPSGGRRRDLIIGYVGQLKKYGYLEDRLVEMPMIVNPNIFKPRILTEEQKAKYGCDIMFASNGSMPTDRIVREILVPEFAGLKAEDRRQKSEDSIQNSELRTLNSELFPEPLLMAIHDHLWEQYRAGKTFTSYQALEQELRSAQSLNSSDSSLLSSRPSVENSSLSSGFRFQPSSFSSAYDSLSEDDRDHVIQTLFWRLNDVIYRHVVLEWLDEIAQSAEGKAQSEEKNIHHEGHPSSSSISVHPSQPPEESGSVGSSSETPDSGLQTSVNNLERVTCNLQPSQRLRIHLYGHGWENHPRFAKYAKGELAHGEELSIAYQAAKFCLHLNNMEGGHQRLLEIISSGACPLTRTSLSIDQDSSLLHSALRIYAQDPVRWLESLPEDECRFINEWFYPIIVRMLKNDPVQTDTEIAQSLHAIMIRQLLRNPDWTVSGWDSLIFKNRAGLEEMLPETPDCDMKTAAQRLASVNNRYLAHSIADALARKLSEKTISATISDNPWQALIQYTKILSQPDTSIDTLMATFHAIRYPHQQIVLDTVNSPIVAKRLDLVMPLLDSLDPNRMTIRQLINYADGLADGGRMDEARAIIALAYTKDPNLKDAHARIAWRIFWPKKEFAKVIEWMERDNNPALIQVSGFKFQVSQTSRLTPGWMLNLAQTFAASGSRDKAFALVKRAYTANPNLKDGYSRCAWQYYWPAKQYTRLIKWIEKDLVAKRLTSAWQLNLAQAYAANGNIQTARKHVASAYKSGPTLKDGYSRIGWECFWADKKYVKVLDFCNRDIKSNRISPSWRANAAKAAAGMGNMNQAAELIEQAYADSPDIKNSYAQIGWQAFALLSAFDRTIPWFERDLKKDRLTGAWLVNYAEALSACGNDTKAQQFVEKAYQNNPKLSNGHARCGWMRYVMVSFEPEKALSGFEKDKALGKLTGQHKIMHAVVTAASGDFAAACSMVKQAYDEHPECTNGYSLIGWYHYLVNHNEPQKALELFKRDGDANRLTPQTHLLEAAIHANIGKLSLAEQIVADIYTESSTAIGGYTLIGCLNYMKYHNQAFAIKMLQKDRELQTTKSPTLKYVHAAFLTKGGSTAEADKLLNDTTVSTLTECFAESWLLRVGFSQKLIAELITHELRQRFQEALKHHD